MSLARAAVSFAVVQFVSEARIHACDSTIHNRVTRLSVGEGWRITLRGSSQRPVKSVIERQIDLDKGDVKRKIDGCMELESCTTSRPSTPCLGTLALSSKSLRQRSLHDIDRQVLRLRALRMLARCHNMEVCHVQLIAVCDNSSGHLQHSTVNGKTSRIQALMPGLRCAASAAWASTICASPRVSPSSRTDDCLPAPVSID